MARSTRIVLLAVQRDLGRHEECIERTIICDPRSMLCQAAGLCRMYAKQRTLAMVVSWRRHRLLLGDILCRGNGEDHHDDHLTSYKARRNRPFLGDPTDKGAQTGRAEVCACGAVAIPGEYQGNRCASTVSCRIRRAGTRRRKGLLRGNTLRVRGPARCIQNI